MKMNKILNDKKNVVIIILTIIFFLILGLKNVFADAVSSSSVSMSSTDSTRVKYRLDLLASKPRPSTCPGHKICIATSFKVGDYVQMIPTSTSYTIPSSLTGYDSDQTIMPSQLRLWRVIRINQDGTIEMVSEYLSYNYVYFKGTVGYANIVGALNFISKLYGNSKYTIKTRYVGYKSQTEFIFDTSNFDGTKSSYPWSDSTTTELYRASSNENLGGGDTLYQYDLDLISAATGSRLWAYSCSNDSTCSSHSNTGIYWLASRQYWRGAGNTEFYGRYIDGSGHIWTHSTSSISKGFREYYYGWSDDSWGAKIRPIVYLKPGVIPSSGNGTSSSPYILP